MADKKRIVNFFIAQYVIMIVIANLLGLTMLHNKEVNDDGSYRRHTVAACMMSASISTLIPFTGRAITEEIMSLNETDNTNDTYLDIMYNKMGARVGSYAGSYVSILFFTCLAIMFIVKKIGVDV